MISRLLARLPFIKKPTWADRHFTFIVVVAGFVAAGLSLLIGMQQSVWFDEAYSIMIAQQPLGELLRLTAIDTHPPFYYILLKGWAAVFGWSELALRSLSALALGGAIVFGGLLIKYLFNARVATITLPFIVFAPFVLRYGFEIRMYVIGSLIGIAATYVLVRALHAKKKTTQWLLYAVYAILVALGVYTLYYVALLWIAHVVWLTWITVRERQSFLKARWLLAYAGSVILFLPWLPTFLSQTNNGALAMIPQPLALENIMGIISFNLMYQPVWQLSVLSSFIIVFAISAIVYFSIKAVKQASAKERSSLLLLAMYLGVPVVVLAIVSLSRPMYVERYLAHVAIGLMLYIGVVTALTLSKKATPSAWLAGGLLLVVVMSGAVQLTQMGNYNFQRLLTPTLDSIVATIGACDDTTAIVAADPYVAIELEYYLPQCRLHFYSPTATLTGGYAPLSDSPWRVTNPVNTIKDAQTIHYVYYDEPELVIAGGYDLVTERTFDATSIRTFSAE